MTEKVFFKATVKTYDDNGVFVSARTEDFEMDGAAIVEINGQKVLVFNHVLMADAVSANRIKLTVTAGIVTPVV